ncbi:MAG: NAD(P)/FAD-dependent oxidoreductase [Mariprofundaceae bacterium]
MGIDQQTFDVIIIGAGAAGLMCAKTAAQRGRSVLLLDHAEKPGKKILISGGGRSNFTNIHTTAANFSSNNPHFCKSSLARFSPYDFIDMVEEAGIDYHERDHGQLFCNDSAKAIVDMLLKHCHKYDVCLKMHAEIHRVEHHELFMIHSSQGIFTSQSLVIATGGLSIPKMGASSFGLKVAEQFNLNIIPTRAGLVPFTFTGKDKDALKSLAGISLNVTASHQGHSFTEAMLFTHRGLSGPAILQVSSYWSPGETINIDLLPNIDIEYFLQQHAQKHPKVLLATALSSLLPKRLVQLLTSSYLDNKALQQITDKQRLHISDQLHNWILKPNGTEGYRTAEVTVGGIDTHELSSKTMQTKKVTGLYFIGEIIDITGHLGGFNFQWAWASGYSAGLDV